MNLEEKNEQTGSFWTYLKALFKVKDVKLDNRVFVASLIRGLNEIHDEIALMRVCLYLFTSVITRSQGYS